MYCITITSSQRFIASSKDSVQYFFFTVSIFFSKILEFSWQKINNLQFVFWKFESNVLSQLCHFLSRPFYPSFQFSSICQNATCQFCPILPAFQFCSILSRAIGWSQSWFVSKLRFSSNHLGMHYLPRQ